MNDQAHCRICGICHSEEETCVQALKRVINIYEMSKRTWRKVLELLRAHGNVIQLHDEGQPVGYLTFLRQKPERVESIPDGIGERVQRREREMPLPHWAAGLAYGALVLGAQLPTRDGRRFGNAWICGIETYVDQKKRLGELASPEPVPLFIVVTDMGNQFKMSRREVEQRFYPPTWYASQERIRDEVLARRKD